MDENKVLVTFRLPEELKVAFESACKANDRNSSQILRDLMREYIKKNNQGELFEKRGKR